MRSSLIRLCLATLFVSPMAAGYACTTFCIKEGNTLLVGKSFDFYTGVGQLVVNKRGVRKSSLDVPPEKVISWTSRYGSITFNQMGAEFPYGGMNEKGLVIEISWLAETEYPKPDHRAGLVELQWIQYQLDNAANVAEVLATDAIVRISSQSLAPVHFFLCDAGGTTATIEYVNGRMVSHTGTTMPVCVLTNDTYVTSSRYLSTLTQQKVATPNFTTSSNDRFAEVSTLLRRSDGLEPASKAFHILEEVRQEGLTQWNIVYDIRRQVVRYKTTASPSMKTVRLSDVDLSCDSPRSIIDIDAFPAQQGAWQRYTFEKNYGIIKEAFAACDFLQGVSEKEILQVARYPETVSCSRNNVE